MVPHLRLNYSVIKLELDTLYGQHSCFLPLAYLATDCGLSAALVVSNLEDVVLLRF